MSFLIGDRVRVTKDLWEDVCQGVGYEEHIYATNGTVGTLVRVIVPDSLFEMRIEEFGASSDELTREVYTKNGDLIGVRTDEMRRID